MFNPNDMFMPDTPQTVAAREQIQKEAIATAKAAGESARSCINTQVFSAYKAAMQRSQEKMVDAMIAYTHNFFQEQNGDLAIYAVNMARYITKIQDLKALLTAVEKDAEKGIHVQKEA